MHVDKDQALKSLWQSHGELVKNLTTMRQDLCVSFAVIRKDRELTFRQAAELADVDESNLSKFEKGRWSTAMAEKLFEAYNK